MQIKKILKDFKDKDSKNFLRLLNSLTKELHQKSWEEQESKGLIPKGLGRLVERSQWIRNATPISQEFYFNKYREKIRSMIIKT